MKARAQFRYWTLAAPSQNSYNLGPNLGYLQVSVQLFHNLMYFRFIGLVENFSCKNIEFFKGSNKNSKNGYWSYCEQQRYLNHTDIFISTFDQI